MVMVALELQAGRAVAAVLEVRRALEILHQQRQVKAIQAELLLVLLVPAVVVLARLAITHLRLAQLLAVLAVSEWLVIFLELLIIFQEAGAGLYLPLAHKEPAVLAV